jgi:hypothetical protein
VAASERGGGGGADGAGHGAERADRCREAPSRAGRRRRVARGAWRGRARAGAGRVAACPCLAASHAQRNREQKNTSVPCDLFPTASEHGTIATTTNPTYLGVAGYLQVPEPANRQQNIVVRHDRKMLRGQPCDGEEGEGDRSVWVTRVRVGEVGGAAEVAGGAVGLAVPLEVAVGGVGAVRAHRGGAVARARREHGGAVRAVPARVVQRLLQRRVRRVRPAHAPRAVCIHATHGTRTKLIDVLHTGKRASSIDRSIGT